MIQRRGDDPPWWPFVNEAVARKWSQWVRRHAIASADCRRRGHTYGAICSRCERDAGLYPAP